jgi:hypothetical protein
MTLEPVKYPSGITQFVAIAALYSNLGFSKFLLPLKYIFLRTERFGRLTMPIRCKKLIIRTVNLLTIIILYIFKECSIR